MKSEIVKLDAKAYRKFGLTTGSIFAILFGVILPWITHHPYPIWPWVLAGVLFAFAPLLPIALGPVYVAWMKIGQVLNWINTRLILGVLFYVLITPVGIVLKLLRKVPIPKSFNKQIGTYRKKCQQKPKETMEQPF